MSAQHLLVLIASTFLFAGCIYQNSESSLAQSDVNIEQASYKTAPVLDSYGFDVEAYKTDQRLIRRNENLASIFRDLGYSQDMVNEAMQKTSGVLDLRKVIAGKPLQLYYEGSNTNVPSHVVYEQNLSEFVIFI